MLNKNTTLDANYFVGVLMDKKDKGNETIITTMNGDFYGKVITVSTQKVILKQEGKQVSVNISDILDVS